MPSKEGLLQSKMEEIAGDKFKDKNILIVSRDHASRNYQILLQQLMSKYKNITLFSLDNQFEDDKWLLYGAMSSKNDCKVISNDLYNNYASYFKVNEDKELFRNWIRKSSIEIDKTTGDFINTKKIEEKIQRTGDNQWHIVYRMRKTSFIPFEGQRSLKSVCIKINKQ
jgi:hypothetical protein